MEHEDTPTSDASEPERFWDEAERVAASETEQQRARRRNAEAVIDDWMSGDR